MTQIDKYAGRVRFWLPGARGRTAAEDVRATLADLIAEREARLGRPLDETEVAAELKAFGRPEIIASRYSLARPLVSAGLMPAYMRVLGIAVAGVVIGQAVLAVFGMGSGTGGQAIGLFVSRSVTGLLWSFASVTVAFAVLTRLYPASAGSEADDRC
ncbi:hypothetical protein [Caulobacter sp. UNC358MFTsu5.1]|uniref:hypothetical protein n=1 Tax=Caulobacter sp. UNC358MFTsu5.1 TaxID=1449049 RepID=UPI0004A72ACF|nr:hypothetical protein [Caulobacter sp. UNC358MFTsu5.1]